MLSRVVERDGLSLRMWKEVLLVSSVGASMPWTVEHRNSSRVEPVAQRRGPPKRLVERVGGESEIETHSHYAARVDCCYKHSQRLSIM